MMKDSLTPGRPVLLDDGEDAQHLVRVPAPEDTVEVDGFGVLSGRLFEGVSLGGTLSLGRRSLHVLPLTPEGMFATLKRGAQIIRPQDAARIAHAAGIGPGTTVIEGGVGSGALTAYLAFLVGDTGTVHGFDVRKDHLNLARENLERFDLHDRVQWHEADLADADIPCDAFLADVPDPASLTDAAARCLQPGGRVAFYNPIVRQVEATHAALHDSRFLNVSTIEQLERGWTVHENGARPEFEMLGHTGFLTFATRVTPPEAGSNG